MAAKDYKRIFTPMIMETKLKILQNQFFKNKRSKI